MPGWVHYTADIPPGQPPRIEQIVELVEAARERYMAAMWANETLRLRGDHPDGFGFHRVPARDLELVSAITQTTPLDLRLLLRPLGFGPSGPVVGSLLAGIVNILMTAELCYCAETPTSIDLSAFGGPFSNLGGSGSGQCPIWERAWPCFRSNAFPGSALTAAAAEISYSGGSSMTSLAAVGSRQRDNWLRISGFLNTCRRMVQKMVFMKPGAFFFIRPRSENQVTPKDGSGLPFTDVETRDTFGVWSTTSTPRYFSAAVLNVLPIADAADRRAHFEMAAPDSPWVDNATEFWGLLYSDRDALADGFVRVNGDLYDMSGNRRNFPHLISLDTFWRRFDFTDIGATDLVARYYFAPLACKPAFDYV